MSTIQLKTADVYDFSYLPDPLDVGTQPLTRGDGGFDEHFHPHVGRLKYKNTSFPYLHVMQLNWQTRNRVSLVNDIPNDNINLIFQLKGQNAITYSGVNHHLDVDTGYAYMVFNPDGENTCEVAADTTLDILTVSLDKDFFAGCIGHDTPWAQETINKILAGKAFSGATRSVKYTPRMQQLISGMLAHKQTGPLANMIMQSQALELVGLHIDQVHQSPLIQAIPKTDAERLQALKTYLDHNFLQEHTLSELCRMFLLNEFKLKKGFKQLFGHPVFAHIRQLRMQHATQLLRSGDMSIEQVANLLGYEHPQHFSTAYKKFTGLNASLIKL